MNSETVDLIATDPPFKKGRDFHATPDSLAGGASFQDRWSWDDARQEWTDKLEDDFPKVMNVIRGSRNSYGDDMGGFLCFMAVRILEMHRVLKQTGSMYLHCDPTASHYLKELMDAIFGRDNFKNEIIWKRSGGHPLSIRKFESITDTILFYWKSSKSYFKSVTKPLEIEVITTQYRHQDSHGKYAHKDLSGGKGGSKEAYLSFKDVLPPQGRAWAPPTREKMPLWARVMLPENYEKINQLEKCKVLDGIGLIYWSKNGKPYFKRYLPENPTRFVPSLWDDISPLSFNSREQQGYPTQKPLELYERMIGASSNKGDIILDPFCGCATTCVAAEKLKRQWIGIDIWDKAHKVVIDRLKKEGYLARSKGGRQDLIVTEGEITYTKKPLKRTDGGSEAVPFLETQLKQFDDRERDPYSNKEKKCRLLEQCGPYCQGCGFKLHERYLELDHKEPRSAGGSNLLRNRILLCGPCNKLKRDLYTLVWLRQKNKKLGYMVNENVLSSLKK